MRADTTRRPVLSLKKEGGRLNPPREPAAFPPSREEGATGYGEKKSGWKYVVASGTCRLFTWATRTPASVMAYT